MAEPTAHEQLFLELINRARLDPGAEAVRTGVSLGTITPASKQPLAFNLQLNDAADAHSAHMLAVDIFSHTGAGDGGPADRMVAAGYTGFYTWGENIAWNGVAGTSLNVAGSVLLQHDNLFRSSGHRANILNDGFREIGIGSIAGKYESWDALMTTQNFASAGTGAFLTGVVYDDTNRNAFYSVGEGRGNVTVDVLAGNTALGSTASWEAGGYAFKTTATGALTVKFSGGGLGQPAGATIMQGSSNTKIDLVNGNLILSSASTELAFSARHLKLLGTADLDGVGTAAGNRITGNTGANVLQGRDGADVLRGWLDDDRLEGGNGADKLFGGAGSDTLVGAGGNDVLTGGPGGDTFVFAGSFGKDTIADFQDGIDMIRFVQASAFDFSDLTITGNGTAALRVGLNGSTVDIAGASPIVLTAADFEFLA